MLVICEECTSKYNIDGSRMKSNRAQFSCRKCGHVIVVEKQHSSSLPTESEKNTTQQSTRETTSEKNKQVSLPDTVDGKKQDKQKRRSLTGSFSIKFYLIFLPVIVFLSMATAFLFVYFKYIPHLMNEQLDLRVSSIATIFSGTIQTPLLVQNYLEVNKEAQRISRLPGVAYAAVVNEQGLVVAGLFGDVTRFDSGFADKVNIAGFPEEIINNNKLPENILNQTTRFTIGGQEIMNRAEKNTKTGASIHVGLYMLDANKAIQQALFSPFAISLISGIFLGGLLLFLAIARFIGLPVIKLTRIVNRISLGELDLTITPHGPREVKELAEACEQMRYSVKNAIERLRKAR